MPAALSLPPRNCDICGTEYQPKHKRARYCSKPCFWKSKNQRIAPEAKEQYAANRRVKWAENREEYNDRQKQYRVRWGDRFRTSRQAYFQKTRQQSPTVILIRNAKARAKEKGLAFDLTHAWARERWTGHCEVTDIPFVIGERGHGPKFFCPTLDRIQPDLGYTQDNCRIILHAVNALKGTGTDDDMLMIAEAIVRKLSKG